MERISIAGFHEARALQVSRLIGEAVGTTSVREYGGLWGVDGEFLLAAAVMHRARFASMIDIATSPGWRGKVDAARAQVPHMEIEFVNSDFRRPHLYPALAAVDTSLLFNVLLHQENYVSVIAGVASRTHHNICVTQPCLRESYFRLPSSASLLQFWPEEVRVAYQEGAHWPAEEPRPGVFTPSAWMWGHTASHLIDVFRGVGWDLADGVVLDGFLGEHWECPMLRFTRSERADLYGGEAAR